MKQRLSIYLLIAACAAAAAIAVAGRTNVVSATKAAAAAVTEPSVPRVSAARGEYLVNIIGCHDCHTPMKMGPKGPEPDMARALSGHPASLVMPPPAKLDGPWVWSAAGTNTAFAGPWGISYTKNLTPDRVSGIGIWTEEMFVKTLRTGRHWGVGRPILPPMPWQAFSRMSDEDLKSIYAYLRTVKPIRNEVPDAVLAPPPPAPKG